MNARKKRSSLRILNHKPTILLIWGHNSCYLHSFAVLECNLKNDRVISICFQGKPFNITIIQVYAPTTNTEEAEVEWFYEDLQDLLELTSKEDVLVIIGAWNAKVGSDEIPGITGKFSLGVQNEAGQRLTVLPENALVIANTLFQQHKRQLYTWTSPDGQYRNQIDYILFFFYGYIFVYFLKILFIYLFFY